MTKGVMERNNDTWLSDLRSEGPQRQAALSDLRARLLHGLRSAFPGWRVDDGLLEDAVQDALLRILDRLPQFEGRSRFLTWATSIAIHGAMSELRRRRWRDVSLDDVLADVELAPESFADAGAEADARRAREAILDNMHHVIQAELTEKQRRALLAELKGMPLDEIARHLSSNRNAVYKLTYDARKRLRRGMEAAGFAAADIHAAFEQ